MMRLQHWENGSYFAAFSLHIPDMRSFLHVREIAKICPSTPIVSIKPMFRCRTPNSLLKFAYEGLITGRFLGSIGAQLIELLEHATGISSVPESFLSNFNKLIGECPSNTGLVLILH